MSSGMFGYMGGGLDCYQAYCSRWGHNFGDEVCKRCGDPVPATKTTGNMLDLINAAIDRGLTDGDVFTITDGDGNEQTVTLGHSVPTLGGRMNLVTVVKGES